MEVAVVCNNPATSGNNRYTNFHYSQLYSMKNLFYILTFVVVLTGCMKNTNTEKAKVHSQKVVKALYKDTVLTYLRSKYLPVDDTRVLIERFRERYASGRLRGSLIHEQYYKNLSGNDEVTFIHRYKSDKDNKIVKIQMTYELIKDTFEVKSLIFFNSATP